MSAGISIGKAIWRKPDEDRIFSISSAGGEDEFIIAPFRKNEKIISIKGVVAECNESSITHFFKDIKPRETSDKHSTPKAHYIKSIENAIDSIKNNRFEKVVFARQHFIEKPIDLQSLFMRLVSHYPGAFVYCFILENGICMIGATPETLLEKKGESLTTEALGGTEQADGYSEKEHHEHRQIITDIEDKLNGSSYIFERSEPKVKIAGNVSHLSTIFKVMSKSVENDLGLLQALHPTSAVCGLPFQPAYDFLIRHEDFDRNYYSGYLGIKKGTDFSFYVNLRSAEIFENGAVLYAGAGINEDSIPENEWLETTNKLDTLLRWMV